MAKLLFNQSCAGCGVMSKVLLTVGADEEHGFCRNCWRHEDKKQVTTSITETSNKPEIACSNLVPFPLKKLNV